MRVPTHAEQHWDDDDDALTGINIEDDLVPDRQYIETPDLEELAARFRLRQLAGRRSTLGPRWVNSGSPIFGGHPWVPAEN